MKNVEKRPNSVSVWSFFNIMHQVLTDRLPSRDCNNQQQGNQLKSEKLKFTTTASHTAK